MNSLFKLILLLSLTGSFVVAEPISHRCPFSCKTANLSNKECRDWRIGNKCFIEKIGPTRKAYVLCMTESTGVLRARTECAQEGEARINLSNFQGPAGPRGEKGEKGEAGNAGATGQTGATGPAGPTGSTGSDGSLRIYGDGSQGARIFSSSGTFQDANPQYTDVTVNSGVTLSVPSGTVLRCTGSFINNGTITVLPPLRDAPRFAEHGVIESSAASSGAESPGGSGGASLQPGVSKSLLRLGLLASGNGYRAPGDTGGLGAGSLTILCSGTVTNNGTITANGLNSVGSYRGGGGGGFIILSSLSSVSNPGVVNANGGNGGALLATDSNSTGYGPGGGGGGGIVHLISPSILTTGTVNINGGSGSAGGGAGAITGFLYYGGGGGGGSGGAGGNGGSVNPGNIGNNSALAGANGDPGQLIQTLADPTSLF